MSKAKSPAINFYTSDFLTGTTFMSNEQVGAYIRLLSYQHQLGHLSEQQVMSITQDNVVLLKFQKDENGLYFNERMEQEITKKNKYSESRSNNRKKSDKDETSSSSNNNHMKNICNSYEKDMKNICKTYGKVQHMENEEEEENINIYNLENKGVIGEEETFNTKTETSDDLFSFVEQAFGRTFNSIEYELISTWEDNELTRYAVKESVLNGARGIRYVEKVLSSWKDKGFKTVQEVKYYQDKYKKNKDDTSAPVPLWFNQTIKAEDATSQEKEELEKILGNYKEVPTNEEKEELEELLKEFKNGN